MTLENLYQMLSYGQLSNLAISGDGSGTIIESGQPKIVVAANEALKRLFGKFILLEKDVLIEQVAHITNYHLDKRFAESSYDPEQVKFPYIKDLYNDPFENDVVKITAVFESYHNKQLPLNDDENQWSLFTPKYNILQVPMPQDKVSLSVMYQALHPILDVERPEQEIMIPDMLEGALTAFIAFQVYNNMNTAESQVKAQGHLQIYNNIVQEVMDGDLVNSSISLTNSRFEKRGWK